MLRRKVPYETAPLFEGRAAIRKGVCWPNGKRSQENQKPDTCACLMFEG